MKYGFLAENEAGSGDLCRLGPVCDELGVAGVLDFGIHEVHWILKKGKAMNDYQLRYIELELSFRNCVPVKNML